MSSPTAVKLASARVARTAHYGTPEEQSEARRDFAAAKIESAVEKALATAPPLTPAQIKRITGLLRSGGAK